MALRFILFFLNYSSCLPNVNKLRNKLQYPILGLNSDLFVQNDFHQNEILSVLII